MKFLKKDLGHRGEIALLALIAIFIMAIWQIGAMCIRDFFDGVSTECWLPFADKDFVDPLGPVALVILVSLIPLLFTKEGVYRTWKKFAKWFIPLTLILVFIIPPGSNSFVFGDERESMLILLTSLYLIISFLIILIQSWRLWGK